MQWQIKFPRKVVSFKNNLIRPEQVETGYDFDELIDYIKEAWEHDEEIEICFYQEDPIPQYLYDATGGEPPLSADERWQQAFDQKRELKS
jgi:hypothetical protein